MSAVLAALLGAPGCRLFHRSAKTVPPPPPPPVEPAAEAPPSEPKQVSLPAPPDLPPKAPATIQPPPSEHGKLPPAPRTQAGKRRRRGAEQKQAQLPSTQQPGATEQAASPAQPAGDAQTAAAPVVPQLEQILSPEQQKALNEDIDRSVRNAQQRIDSISGRRLNQEQTTYLDRIRTFIQQATEARRTDLFRAKNLAERASVLAEDLVRTLQ